MKTKMIPRGDKFFKLVTAFPCPPLTAGHANSSIENEGKIALPPDSKSSCHLKRQPVKMACTYFK